MIHRQMMQTIMCLTTALICVVLAACAPLPVPREGASPVSSLSATPASELADISGAPFSLAGYPEEMQRVLNQQLAQTLAGGPQLELVSPIPEGFLDQALAAPMDKFSLLEAAETGPQSQALLVPSAYDIYTYSSEVRKELGPLPVDWFNVLEGEILPITIDGATPATYTRNTKADRPPLLGLGSDGQSVPYSRIGRFEGVNPETGQPDPDIMWSFIGRRYKIRTDPNDPLFEDVAIVGHNARTGATAFFQMLDSNAKDATCVPSPMASNDDLPETCPTAETFWLSPFAAAGIGCNGCHSADPFIHTPYVDQVTITDPNGASVPIVPSVSGKDAPYWFVGSQAFNSWPAPQQFRPAGSYCIGCHRIGADSRGVRFVEWAAGGVPAAPWHISDTFGKYPNSHWMPPGAAQSVRENAWERNYRASVEQLISCFADSAQPACKTQAIPGSTNP